MNQLRSIRPVGLLLPLLAVFAVFAVSPAVADTPAAVDPAASATPEQGNNRLSEAEQRSGWQLLFDGQTLDGWRNYKRDDVSSGWQVAQGELRRSGKNAGDLITAGKYKWFELSLEYKIAPEGNSGLMFHVVEGDGPSYHSGPEVQIQDNVGGHDPQKSGWLYQLYRPIPPAWVKDQTVMDATRPAGQWNQLYLRIAEKDCEVCVNGLSYYHFRLNDDAWKERVAQSKFAQWPTFAAAGEGHLCLQDHGDEVAFRNIKLRQINDDGSVPQPVDGDLAMIKTLAFPKLQWADYEAIDDAGRIRQLRLMDVTFADDDSNRLFAVSQAGQIWSFQNDPEVTESTMLLDLSDKVVDFTTSGANEEGLLGFAPHPKFKDNGYFYVYYSDINARRSIVSRFQISEDDPDVADPDSETIIMTIDQPFKNHNGGSMEFGSDGYLYIALGDGGDRNDPEASGQDLRSLLGKILRIDVDSQSDGNAYGIPADNPFVGVAQARPEIYAYGVRNPWRIAFDRATGTLWAGEVGQDRWEEVLIIEKGGNYGWSNREGSQPFGNRGEFANTTAPLPPVWEYDHLIGQSITGGRVCRSADNPLLDGKYLYADYVAGTVWALTIDPETKKAIRNERVIADSVPVLGFGHEPGGDVFMLTNSPRGECIYRFVAPVDGEKLTAK